MARQPEGPLHLAGYSYGGLVAYEMARLLTERGRKVENLILFDTYPPNEKYRYKHYGLQYVLLSFLCLVTSPGNLRDFFRNQYWRSLQRRAKSVAKRLPAGPGCTSTRPTPSGKLRRRHGAARPDRLRLFKVLARRWKGTGSTPIRKGRIRPGDGRTGPLPVAFGFWLEEKTFRDPWLSTTFPASTTISYSPSTRTCGPWPKP
jgi:pimeloyl-ACP methyl ester carboxylesterase